MCSQGFETAKKATLQFLETFRDKIEATDREILLCVARTSLRTKLYQDLADQLTDIVVDAVLTIRKEDEPLDLYMVYLPQHMLSTPLLQDVTAACFCSVAAYQIVLPTSCDKEGPPSAITPKLMLLLNNADVCNLHMHATLSPAITSCSMHSCKDTRRSKTDNLHCTPLPYAVLNAVQTAVQPPRAGDTMLSFLSLQLSQSDTST